MEGGIAPQQAPPPGGLGATPVADAVVELAEVVVSYALWRRGVYPAWLFRREQRWGVTTRIPTSAALASYVAAAAAAAGGLLGRGGGARLALVLLGPGGGPAVERLVLSVVSVGPREVCDGTGIEALERGFATLLGRYAAVDLPPLPAGCTFELALHEGAGPPWQAGAAPAGEEARAAQVELPGPVARRPLGGVSTALLELEAWVELGA